MSILWVRVLLKWQTIKNRENFISNNLLLFFFYYININQKFIISYTCIYNKNNRIKPRRTMTKTNKTLNAEFFVLFLFFKNSFSLIFSFYSLHTFRSFSLIFFFPFSLSLFSFFLYLNPNRLLCNLCVCVLNYSLSIKLLLFKKEKAEENKLN